MTESRRHHRAQRARTSFSTPGTSQNGIENFTDTAFAELFLEN